MKIRPTTGEPRERPVTLRAGDLEWEIIEIASRITNMTPSHFIINCALKRACEICAKDTKNNYDYIISKIQPLLTKEN